MNTCPETFPFPFEPYPIQVDFMRSLYAVLDESRLGIFESPTGTGKSMAIICGMLTWMQDYETARKKELKARIGQLDVANAEEDDSNDDWFAAAVSRKKDNEEKQALQKELDFLTQKEARIAELKRTRKTLRRDEATRLESEFDDLFKDLQDVKDAVRRELMKEPVQAQENFDDQDEEIIVDDYLSDGEDHELARPLWQESFDDEEDEDFSVRIFYCSRTHSQLSQFVREIQRSPFNQDVRLISLASRGNMCINDSVKALGNNSLINDRCLEMQKQKSKKKPDPAGSSAAKRPRKAGGQSQASCPFFKQSPIATLRDMALLQVLDIEELTAAGRKHEACPYYASRKGTDDAQIIILPYNTLLHRPTRESIGLKLKRSIVVVDEAHNLLDTITHIHSIEVTGSQLCRAWSQVSQYCSRYKSRLKAKNLLYIKQIIFTLSNLIRILGGKAGREPKEKSNIPSRMIETHILLTEAEIFNLNFFKIVKYIQKSKLVQKLLGFQEKYGTKAMTEKSSTVPSSGLSTFLKSLKEEPKKKPNDALKEAPHDNSPMSQSVGSSPLLIISEFLLALVNVKSDSRILINNPDQILGRCSIKYILLNPSSQFTDLVTHCRAIVVAGGTMQPVQEFKHQLFINAGASESRIKVFSCGHVIPKENILPIVATKGPTGKILDFSYEHRSKAESLDELYRVLNNISNLIPGGIVVFFPSYEYESLVYKHFEKSGYLAKLTQKKQVFREPKRADQMETELRNYSRSAKGKGALLLSVVGGKMSEGINFSDHLGRCVVMVGLPFPNAKSLELKEKMAYLDKTVHYFDAGQSAGRVHYENLCMKAVNQSVGRAIRHRGDYACILLLDHRYQRTNIVKQLPSWMQEQVVIGETFGKICFNIGKFFRNKKPNTA